MIMARGAAMVWAESNNIDGHEKSAMDKGSEKKPPPNIITNQIYAIAIMSARHLAIKGSRGKYA